MKTKCAWCGATDQNLIEMVNGTIACEDWRACAEREQKADKNEPPGFTDTPWGKRKTQVLPPPHFTGQTYGRSLGTPGKSGA